MSAGGAYQRTPGSVYTLGGDIVGLQSKHLRCAANIRRQENIVARQCMFACRTAILVVAVATAHEFIALRGIAKSAGASAHGRWLEILRIWLVTRIHGRLAYVFSEHDRMFLVLALMILPSSATL